MASSADLNDLKQYHVFISYRVNSDAALAEKICDKIQQHNVGNDLNCRFLCFLDKQNLRVGEPWKECFLKGLTHSCLFMPLLSRGSLDRLVYRNYNSEYEDNLLLELETALKLKSEGKCVIYPLFVGEVGPGGYSRFNEWGKEFGDKPCKGGTRSPKDVLQEVFEVQGSFCNPDEIAGTP
tara:strand:- start:684 stop:1223 length:540 start_codon:yes stop_codon:yes gene_type:complete